MELAYVNMFGLIIGLDDICIQLQLHQLQLLWAAAAAPPLDQAGSEASSDLNGKMISLFFFPPWDMRPANIIAQLSCSDQQLIYF